MSLEDLSTPNEVEVSIGDIIAIISGDVTVQSGVLTIAQISGQTLQLQSGTTVQLPVTQVVKISGDIVVIASGAVIHRGLLSGLGIIIGSISGQGTMLPATQVVKISGEVVGLLTPTGGLARALLLLDDNSGGTILTSGTIVAAILKAPKSNSGIIYIGFDTSTEMPYSGFGIMLEPGDWHNLWIDNLGYIRAMSTISGFATLSYGGTTP